MEQSCDSRESRNDLILMSAIIPGNKLVIHRVSLLYERQRNGPRNCRLPVCTRWVNNEEDEVKRGKGDRARVRERERERKSGTTVECLLGTYRAVTECKGRKEGSAVTPSEENDGRGGGRRER